MTTAYQRVRERLSELHPGMSDREASLIASGGKNPDLVRSIKRGRSQFPRGENLQGLARLLDVNVDWFVDLGDSDPSPTSELRRISENLVSAPVAVAGRVAAGAFLEVDDFDQSEPEIVWEPADSQFPNARRMAFDVAEDGDSMNALKPRPILPGDRLICVAWEDVADRVKIRDGLVVVVERTREGGHIREWSVKQVELYEDRIEFCPRSTNARHKPIVVKRDAQPDDGTQVEIIALVRAVRNEFPL